MVDRPRRRLDQRGEVDAFGSQFAPPLARDLEDGVDQTVHLARRRADEADRLGDIDPQGLLRRGLLLGRGRGSGFDIGVDRLEHSLQLAGEAHDVHQGRAQIMRHDIGEALDLLIGLDQRIRALAHALFEADVEDLDLPARRDELAGIADDGPARRTGHGQDEDGADNRRPAEPVRSRQLRVDRFPQFRFRRCHDGIEVGAQFIHQPLAGSAADQRRRRLDIALARRLHRGG